MRGGVGGINVGVHWVEALNGGLVLKGGHGHHPLLGKGATALSPPSHPTPLRQ